MDYDLNSEFDIEQHKQTFINYLEILIEANGHVVYAVPSHIEKAVALACEALHVSRPELEAMCPPEFYYDYNVWVLRQSGAIMVWNNFFVAGGELTRPQQAMLRKLKLSGLYKGPIHNKIY